MKLKMQKILEKNGGSPLIDIKIFDIVAIEFDHEKELAIVYHTDYEKGQEIKIRDVVGVY